MEEWIYPHAADVLATTGLHPLHHYIDKRRNTIYTSVRNWPILLECMGAECREGTSCRLNWWHQTLDYMGKGEGKEARPTGGLDSSALSASSPPTPPPPTVRRAPAPPQRPRSPVVLLNTAEQEHALWRATHFHD